MADIEVDTALLRALATRLAVLADRAGVLAARAGGVAPDVRPLGGAVAARHDELCAGLARHVQELALLADGLRRAADDLTATDQDGRRRMTAITRGLAGAGEPTSGPA